MLLNNRVLHMDPCQPCHLVLLKAKSRSNHFHSEIFLIFFWGCEFLLLCENVFGLEKTDFCLFFNLKCVLMIYMDSTLRKTKLRSRHLDSMILFVMNFCYFMRNLEIFVHKSVKCVFGASCISSKPYLSLS